MSVRPTTAMVAALLPVVLYALFPATVYRGDGMSYASFLQSGSPELLNPNHLLYGVLVWVLYCPVRGVWADADPMVILRAFTLLQALVCLAIFHRLLGKMKVAPAARTGFTLCLAGTAGFWLQAISPETFLLSMILDLIVFTQAARLLKRPDRVSAIRLGGAVGIAVLGNQVAALLVPACALVVWRAKKEGRTGNLLASGAAALTVITIGFAASALVVKPERPLEWLAGRAATPAFVDFSPDSLLWDARNLLVSLLPKLSRIEALLADGDRSPLTLLHATLVCGALLLLGVLIWRSRRALVLLPGPGRTLLAALGIYLAGLTLFFSFWANQLAEFWSNHWLLIWLILALGSKEALPRERTLRLVPSLLGLILIALGFLFVGLPLNRSEEGWLARRLAATVPRQDLLLVVWNEEMPMASNVQLRGTASQGLARSTFAVNLATYLNRPVVHAGCWHSAGPSHCFESHPGGELLRAVRERLEAGRGAWVLQASAEIPSEGLSQPEVLDTLLRGAASHEVWRMEGGETLTSARLLRLGP